MHGSGCLKFQDIKEITNLFISNNKINMDNFSTFSKEHINIKNSIKNINCAVVTGGAGRVGSVFTKILLSNKIKVFCLSRSMKNFNNFRKSLTKSEQSYLNFYKCDLANFKYR